MVNLLHYWHFMPFSVLLFLDGFAKFLFIYSCNLTGRNGTMFPEMEG